MRIVVLGDGQSQHTLKWVTELAKFYDVWCIAMGGFLEGFSSVVAAEKLISLNISQKSGGGNYRALLSLPQLLRNISILKPNVINAHYLTSYGFLGALVSSLLKKKPIFIASCWGSDIHTTPNKNLLLKYITKFTLKRADIVTSDSQWMTGLIGKLAKGRKILTFPFGLDHLVQMKFEEKDPYCLFSNRALSANYQIQEILQWFERIVAEDSRYHLVVGNSGPLEEELKKFVRRCGLDKSVNFVGKTTPKDQEKCYRKAMFFISNPARDSTSVSLLEAMAHGCTPIVSNIPANLEWIVPDENGLILSPSLNAAILKGLDVQKSFHVNRRIVSEKALFSENFKPLLEAINQYTIP